MSDTVSCADCRFFKEPKEPHVCGICEYPVPAWLRWNAGGGYVSMHGQEAEDCPVFEDVLGRGKEE